MVNKHLATNHFSIIWTYCILSILIMTSCSQIKERSGECHPEYYVDTCRSIIQGKSILFLIADATCDPPTQAILCEEYTVKHGFIELTYPFEYIQKQDVVWEQKLEIDGTLYPTVERRLKSHESILVESIIAKLESLCTPYVYDVRDDYLYIIYLNDKKVVSVSEMSLGFDDFPPDLRNIINDILTLGEPLYPNFGFMIHSENRNR